MCLNIVVHASTQILVSSSPDQYLALSNGEKYKAVAVAPVTTVTFPAGENSCRALVVVTTHLTPAARALFADVNIDTTQSDAHQVHSFLIENYPYGHFAR